ncbi:MAG TPA: TRAM domain-containing protein, partial [Ktedonobacterales bacterium]|nr:TRAM domain-containing protein [Ktedonobacterales bacterium]
MQDEMNANGPGHGSQNGARPYTAPSPTLRAPQALTAPGETIELELTDLAYGGDAVGRYNQRAVFVPGGLPGELVRAQLQRERSNYARATLLDVLRPSPERVAPRYPELSDSGGFQWQHIAYPAQLEWKTRIVSQLLMRIGKFNDFQALPT